MLISKLIDDLGAALHMRHIHHMGLVNLDGASTAPCFRGSLYSTTESNAIILIVREEGRGNN